MEYDNNYAGSTTFCKRHPTPNSASIKIRQAGSVANSRSQTDRQTEGRTDVVFT